METWSPCIARRDSSKKVEGMNVVTRMVEVFVASPAGVLLLECASCLTLAKKFAVSFSRCQKTWRVKWTQRW